MSKKRKTVAKNWPLWKQSKHSDKRLKHILSSDCPRKDPVFQRGLCCWGWLGQRQGDNKGWRWRWKAFLHRAGRESCAGLTWGLSVKCRGLVPAGRKTECRAQHAHVVWKKGWQSLQRLQLGYFTHWALSSRDSSLHHQAAAAQWLFSGLQFPWGSALFTTNDHSLFHTESVNSQSCLLDLHTPSYVYSYKNMLQNPKLLSQSHGLLWVGWGFSPKSECLLISMQTATQMAIWAGEEC